MFLTTTSTFLPVAITTTIEESAEFVATLTCANMQNFIDGKITSTVLTVFHTFQCQEPISFDISKLTPVATTLKMLLPVTIANLKTVQAAFSVAKQAQQDALQAKMEQDALQAKLQTESTQRPNLIVDQAAYAKDRRIREIESMQRRHIKMA